MFDFESSRIALVGPLPPPSGGMANQAEQLARLLRSEGATVDFVRTNRPYRPAFVESLRFVRAGFRLVPYGYELRRAARDATVMHVFANSGWSWHLFAAPAIRAANASGTPVVVNYRGGDAERFFRRSFRRVRRSLDLADAVVVPSAFLQGVFREFGVSTEIVPNVIDLERFRPRGARGRNGSGPRLLIARNLEPIYDVETGIRTLALLRREIPGAHLDVAGSGPEQTRLEALARELGVEQSVRFTGRVDNDRMPELYRDADIALNTSLVDNMPISVLEALACGVPVVSTDVGGVPALVEDGREALLVPARDPEAMSRAVATIWRSDETREALGRAGLAKAKSFGWPRVRELWRAVYDGLAAR